MRSIIYRTHTWLGLIVTVPLLAWTSSGLLYAWPRAVDGGKVESIAPGSVRVTPGEALQRADDFAGRKLPTTALTLLMREGRPFYQAIGGMGADSLFIECRDGPSNECAAARHFDQVFSPRTFLFFCWDLADPTAGHCFGAGFSVSVVRDVLEHSAVA